MLLRLILRPSAEVTIPVIEGFDALPCACTFNAIQSRPDVPYGDGSESQHSSVSVTEFVYLLMECAILRKVFARCDVLNATDRFL